jgi:small GTP-binding protein
VPIDAGAPGKMEPQMRDKGMGAKAEGVRESGRSAEQDGELHSFETGISPLPPPSLSLGLRTVMRATKKICVLGDPAVGKTSIIRRFALDCFDDVYTTTVGARILQKPIVLEYPEPSSQVWLNLRIWEISGQNRHLELYPAYYRGAEGALVVGDVARKDTQVNIWKWIEGFRAVAGRVPIFLLVNKTDIMEMETYDQDLVVKLSSEFGCPYRMVSAKTGANVESAFRELGDRLVGRNLIPSWRRGKAF